MENQSAQTMENEDNLHNQNLPTEETSVQANYFWNVFCHGESQLSESIYKTSSYLKGQLPYQLVIPKIPDGIKPTIVRFKERFDKIKPADKEKISEGKYTIGNIIIDNLKAVDPRINNGTAIWAPVFDYLIKNIPDAYTFHGEHLFVEYVATEVSTDDDDYSHEISLATCVKGDGKIFNKPPLRENIKEDVNKLDKMLKYSVIITLITFVISSFLSPKVASAILILFLVFLGYSFYKKSKIVKVIEKEEKVLEVLFPERQSMPGNSNEVLLDLSSKKDEVKKFNELYQKGFKLGYVQLDKYIATSFRKDGVLEPLTKRERAKNPLMFVREENMVIIATYDGINKNPIVKKIMELDLQKLNVPHIIYTHEIHEHTE